MGDRLQDIDFTSLLPPPLKNDTAVLALAKVIAAQLRKNVAYTKHCIVYARIKELEEDVLDTLADDLHVDWYDASAPIETKRLVVSNSVKTHKGLGTKRALEAMLVTYYGDVWVQEWWEYGGAPHHFKIFTTNAGIVNDSAQAKRFARLLEAAKRKSAWLDGVIVSVAGNSQVYVGLTVAQHTHEEYSMLLPKEI